MASPLLLSHPAATETLPTIEATITRRIRRRCHRRAPFLRSCCCNCCSCHVRPRRQPRVAATPPVLLVLVATVATAAFLQEGPRATAAFAVFPPEPTPAQEPGCSPTLSVLFRNQRSRTPPGADRRRGRGQANEPLPEFFFDPLGLATVQNFARYREAELKAGRVAMLALLQTMVVPLAKAVAPAAPSASSSWLPWESIARMNGGILTNAATPQDLAKVIGTCFVLESVLTMPEPDSMPGDYGWGWFGRRDKGRHERELICELEHCRLAMMAIAVQLILEQKTGLPWEQQWMKLLQGDGVAAGSELISGAIAPDVAL